MWNAMIIEQLAAERQHDVERAAAQMRPAGRPRLARSRAVASRLFARRVEWSPRLWTHSIDTTQRCCAAPRAMPW